MQKVQYFFLSLFITVIFGACNTSKNPFLGKRSPHEKYGDNIKDAGLQQTQLGRLWFAAADKSLQQPQLITLPYKEIGYFSQERPSAASYIFHAQRGENILVELSTLPGAGILYFAELWEPGNGKSSLLTTMDTLNHQLKYTVKKDGEYVLRIQPELLRSMEYTVTISAGPSLAFPVASSGNPRLISFWGAGRDAGARKHEGVDIQAQFRTPALAATGGIARVNENDLGGKVVFIYDASTGNSLYYAHLDSQIVHTGEGVSTGEVVGLIGKTGNAIHTVPHLHFGIYTGSGAINPLPFIEPKISKPKPVTASINELNKWIRTTTTTNIYDGPSAKSGTKIKAETGSSIFVLSATDDWYKIQLPDGKEGYINDKLITNKKLRTHTLKDSTRLLDSASISAPAKKIIEAGNTVDILGSYDDFYLVNSNGLTGWIMKN